MIRPLDRPKTLPRWAELRPACVREARRFVGESDAQDVAQEALLRAYRHFDRCRTPEAPLPWLLTIVRREALRRRARREAEPIDTDPPDLAGEDAIGRAGLRVDVACALRSLSAAERRLVALRYVFDMSTAELARHLGIPEGTVRVR